LADGKIRLNLSSLTPGGNGGNAFVAGSRSVWLKLEVVADACSRMVETCRGLAITLLPVAMALASSATTDLLARSTPSRKLNPKNLFIAADFI